MRIPLLLMIGCLTFLMPGCKPPLESIQGNSGDPGATGPPTVAAEESSAPEEPRGRFFPPVTFEGTNEYGLPKLRLPRPKESSGLAVFEVGDEVKKLPPGLRPLGALLERVGRSPGWPMKLEATRPWFAYEKEPPHRVRAVDFSRELKHLEMKAPSRPPSPFRERHPRPDPTIARPQIELTDTDLELLLPHDDLLRLSLCNTAVTDEGLVHLRHMKKLRVLDLSETHVNHLGAPRPRWIPRPEDETVDPPLDELAALEILLVGGRGFHGGLEQLTALKHLKVLHCKSHYISIDEFESLSKVDSLKEFRIGGRRAFSDVAFLRFFAFHPNLETLQIQSSSPPRPNPYLTDIAHLTQLKHLDLEGTHSMPMEAISRLHRLETLRLYYGPGNKNLHYLAPLKNLRSLHAVRSFPGDPLGDGMRHLTGMDQLESLEFSTQLTMTPSGTRYLNELPSLRRIEAIILGVRNRPYETVDMKLVEHAALEAIDFRFRTLPSALIISDCPKLEHLKLVMEPHTYHNPLGPDCHLSDLSAVETIELFPKTTLITHLELAGDLSAVRTFRLGMKSMSTQQLHALSRMPNLEELELRVDQVAGTTRMLKKTPINENLNTIRLTFGNRVDLKSIRKLFAFLKRTPHVKHLTVNLNRQSVPVDLLGPITELKNLRTLELIDAQAMELGDDFFRELPRLRSCKINGRAVDLPAIEPEPTDPSGEEN